MCAEPPPAGRGLVDRPAHERVTEAESPRYVRLSDEIALQQFVERRHRGRLRQLRGGRGELELERIARHGGSLQHPARTVGKQRELLAQRCGHRLRHLHARQRDAGDGQLLRRTARRAGELLEIEGVAAAAPDTPRR